jgi:hypothetical protein
LAPQTDRTAAQALLQLSLLLGRGNEYRHSTVPRGCEVISSIQWTPWPDVIVRCTILKTPKDTVLTSIEYGRREFLRAFAPLAEHGRSVGKGYEF